MANSMLPPNMANVMPDMPITAPMHNMAPRGTRVRVGGFLRPAIPSGGPVYPMQGPLGPTVQPPLRGSTDPFRAFAGWLHAFINKPGPSAERNAIQVATGQHDFLTYNEPMPTRVIRLFNPHMRTFKGLKNFGGTNNYDSLYLPRVIRFNGRRSASPYAVQFLKGTKAVQSTVPIRSVFVPKGLQ